MTLPYQNATTGQRAIEEIQKILRGFGCTKFATGEDFESGEMFIQFEHKGRMIQLKASAKGYAAAGMKLMTGLLQFAQALYQTPPKTSKQDDVK